jgi:hypothetical protein
MAQVAQAMGALKIPGGCYMTVILVLYFVL